MKIVIMQPQQFKLLRLFLRLCDGESRGVTDSADDKCADAVNLNL
jgi:hypothetical protein